MGRKKKIRGKVFENADGTRVRVNKGSISVHHLFQTKAPRGKTGKSWELTTFLKERVPLVYVFVVEELRQSESHRNPVLQKFIKEWDGYVPPSRTVPNAIDLTAYIIERAMGVAWQLWGLKPPYNGGNLNSFYRRYVRGTPPAIRDFREALRMPQPWSENHVGHELKWFLGEPGEAARHYKFDKHKETRVAVVSITEEK